MEPKETNIAPVLQEDIIDLEEHDLDPSPYDPE